MQTMTTQKTIITHDGAPVAVVTDEDAAFAWLLRHQGQSVSYAREFGGYDTINAEPWDEAKTRELRGTARQLLHDPWHQRGHDGYSDDLTRSNCGACVLLGYRGEGDDSTDDDGPNYAGWARVYVEAHAAVPARWKRAFAAELHSENTRYADALARSIVTFGVTFR